MTKEDKQIHDYIAKKMEDSDKRTKEIDHQMENDKKKLDSIVKTKLDTIHTQMNTINQYKTKMKNIPDQIGNQEKVIAEKNNLITTRLLMLENTRRKNMYKKKLVYTTIAIIILVFIIMMCAYVYSNKQYKVKDFNKNVALKK